MEQRASGRPPLVTDVGVRLPAQLTASGRAMLADLPLPHVKALFPDADAFVDRHGTGPRKLSDLRRLLIAVRRAGHATEDGEASGKRARTWAGGRWASTARPLAVSWAGSRTPTSVTRLGRPGARSSIR